MNLERLEELCVNYLSQAANPLAPVSALAVHCRRDDACKDATEELLLDFLRPHELFQVVEGPEEDDPVNAEVFKSAGLDMGPRVIIKTHIPSPGEMSVIMQEQLDAMTETLSAALAEARARGEQMGLEALQSALERAEALRAELRGLR